MLLILPAVSANTYVVDLGFVTSQTIYTTNETLELKGNIFLTNYSDNGTMVSNHTGVVNTTVNISIINANTNTTSASYNLNTTTNGEFYSKSTFYPAATQILAPTTAGDFYVKASYTDAAGTIWWTKSEIEVVNQSMDRLEISTDKISYNPSETMSITAEAVQEVGDRITYVANVSVNGSVRDSSKSVLSNFSCITGSNGKCTVQVAAPSSYGDYFIEANNFKAFGSFQVTRFGVNIEMKDELGKSIKNIFNTGEQASVEVTAITNSTSETYTFTGIIKGSSGSVVKNISSVTLNYSNAYTNRFTFLLDALTFQAGTYFVDVNVTKTGDGVMGAATSFEVKSWSILMKKRDTSSGFEYYYSAFPNKTISLEIYATWRANGSIISDINTTTSINISLLDKMNNQIATANATWNSTCGKEGCYSFSMETPLSAGEYFISATVSYNLLTQTARKAVNVIGASIFAQSTDKDGALKDLFGANEFAYITLSAKNTTAAINLTQASLVSVVYMNGTEFTYTQVNDFGSVNSTNNVSEWAWNLTLQQLKMDTPSAGGVYTVHITADNTTAATSAKFLVNPYDVCMVAKNTAGQAGGSTGYYYVYQFKVSDTIYFELKLTKATNPTGRASFLNQTNSSHGMGTACSDLSSTKQVINNATITLEEVTSMDTGKSYTLNTTASSCQADDTKGSYTCTIKPIGNWDGGRYGVKLKMVGQDGQSDIAYGGFEARAFYLYAWSSNWQNKPGDNIALNVYMYEAGNNWWGNFGSGGLSGTVKVEKVEYQGRDGEWLWPPIEYGYNVSLVNTSTITNGQGTLTLPVSNAPNGQWKTGSYRAILKGTDNGGNSDYGYAWFSIRKWELYASPVECTGNSCTSIYNLHSRSNISLYVTINNAGQWGQSGNSLGGDVAVSVKKIQDCRKWPCSDLNSTLYTATTINVTKSNGWYWGGNINSSYMINLTPITGSWGSGYWQVVLEANSSETGTGWFNTIAFYVEALTSDSSGNGKYSVRNSEPIYFKVTTTKSQKNGYYYSSYNSSDYLNTTIDSAVLRVWDQSTYRQIEYKYPDNFNISILNGGSTINGSRILNVTFLNGSWLSGYYWGELTLRNTDNETSTGGLWFEVKPFRVEITGNPYTTDDDVCINGTISVYDPGWTSNTVLSGTYNITSVIENVWTAQGSSMTVYTNYTPSGSFNGNGTISICPNGTWGTGSWGNYHYLTITVTDNQSNSGNGWLSFRTVPFSISWGSISGGTSVMKTSNIVVPVTLTKPLSGANTSGNLSKIFQWRYDTSRSVREEYVFSVGSCYSNVTGTCMVNGTQNVTVYAPSGGWKDGYNYLQSDWFVYNNRNSIVQDFSGIWFNGISAYSGWFSNSDESGNWKYYFNVNENLSVKLTVSDSSSNPATVNVTLVEYSTPSTNCWDEYCRSYNTATYSIVGRADTNISGNGTIRIVKSSGNWNRGYVYFRVTVSGSGGTATIKNGNVYVKDTTAPTVNITAPLVNSTINTSTFWINATTSESATCYIYIANYGNFNSWYCGSWNSSNATNSSIIDACNATKYGFGGTSYFTDYISRDSRSWGNGTDWGWSSSSTGLRTGGTSHYYLYTITTMPAQHYGIQVACNDEDWNYVTAYTAVRVNLSIANASQSSGTQNYTSVTLSAPANGASVSGDSNVTFTYSFTGPPLANCSLYGNFSVAWALNSTSNNLTASSRNFSLNLSNGTYIWNVYCVESTNSSNSDWGNSNFTFSVNSTAGSSGTGNTTNVTLLAPSNGTVITANSNVTFTYSFAGPATANCSLYGNFSASWALNTSSNNLASGTRTFPLNLSNGAFIWNVYCVDSTNISNFDWGNANLTFTMNFTSLASNQTNVTLNSPLHGATVNTSLVAFNYSFSGPATANCSLYGNFSGSWALNTSSNNLAAGSTNLSLNLSAGNYIWNAYCIDALNASNTDWGNSNFTFNKI